MAPADGPLVAYLDDDHAVARGVHAQFMADLAASRPLGSPRERHEFVRVDPTDARDVGAGLARAVAARPALIVATSWPIALASRQVAGDVPVLFMSHPDPVAKKLVANLAAPGGNMSGVTFFLPLDVKRVELMRELAPGARTLGVLCDRWYLQLESTAPALAQARERFAFEVRVLAIEHLGGLEARLKAPPYDSVDAWYVPDTLLSFSHGEAIVEALAALGKPTVYGPIRLAELGGIAALYPRALPVQRRLPVLARMVLEGTPPGKIPVEGPMSVMLAVNLDAAKLAGITIPPAVIRRADRLYVQRP